MEYKLRTIDVWDTLLRRNCPPECIKMATAQHLLLGWIDQIKPEFHNILALHRARLDIERSIAKHAVTNGKDDEYEITQVFKQWTAVIFVDMVPASLPDYLTEFEFSTELDRSFRDTEISDFLNSHTAEKTLFLSDFYMNADMLGRLIASKGLHTLVPAGLSSCDMGFNKRSGNIFRHIHSMHGISPDQHLHIGDNELSDVLSPRKIGVHTVHYLPKSAHAERVKREHLFSSRELLFKHICEECTQLGKNASNGLSAPQAAALYLGTQVAPLFLGFMLWIAEQCIIQKLNRLYFFTREGEFFYKVFCKLVPHGRLSGHALPPSDVLEVSRLSTFTASMKDASIQEMSRIWSLFKVQNVSGLFSTLGLDIDNFSKIIGGLGLKSTDNISDPGNNPAMRRLFEVPEFCDALSSSLTTQASFLKSYLEQSGIRPGDRVGVVDIGWRGTIQDNIAMLAPEVHFHGLYLGLRRFINIQPRNSSKAAYGPDENKAAELTDLFMNFAAMELLCTSANGSVVGYSSVNGRVKSRRHIETEENRTYYEFVASFQEGVLLAAQHWQPYIERYVVSSNELRKMALHIWDTLRRTPDEGLVDAYLRTPQQDIFGYGDIFKRSQYPSLTSILLSPISPSRRRRLIEFIRRVQWSEAIAQAKDIRAPHRTVLLLIFRAANLVKRRRLKARLTKHVSRHK